MLRPAGAITLLAVALLAILAALCAPELACAQNAAPETSPANDGAGSAQPVVGDTNVSTPNATAMAESPRQEDGGDIQLSSDPRLVGGCASPWGSWAPVAAACGAAAITACALAGRL